MLLIDNEVVERVLDMRDCIAVQETAFAGLLTGAAIGRPRIDTYVPCDWDDGYYRYGSVEGTSDGILAVRLKSDILVWPRAGEKAGSEQKFCMQPGTYCGLVFLFSTGNGEPGTNGGPPGDLYIEIRLKKHNIFERDGDDLHCEVPISFTTAALGGEIDVPTLAGKAAIDIPEGTQGGKQFRLRGKGIKGVRSSYPGDLYCHIRVETPVKLTEHQRKLLKELDESLKKGGTKHSPNDKGWFDKAKEFFS